LKHPRDALAVDARSEEFGQRGGDALKDAAVADEIEIGIHRKPGRGQNSLGRNDVIAVKAESRSQAQPALDAALVLSRAVMVRIAGMPLAPEFPVREVGQERGDLPGNNTLVIISSKGPSLHLRLGQMAAMQQLVKGM